MEASVANTSGSIPLKRSGAIRDVCSQQLSGQASKQRPGNRETGRWSGGRSDTHAGTQKVARPILASTEGWLGEEGALAGAGDNSHIIGWMSSCGAVGDRSGRSMAQAKEAPIKPVRVNGTPSMSARLPNLALRAT